MGCGGAKEVWPTDVNAFLEKHAPEKKLIAEGLIDAEKITTFSFMANTLISRDGSVIKKGDGTEIFKMEATAKLIKVCSMSGDPLAFLVPDTRKSMVAGSKADANFDHMYIYSLTPYLKGAPAHDLTYEEKPLYPWARVHREEGLSSGKIHTFELCVASRKLNANLEKVNSDMFGAFLYRFKLRMEDGAMMVQRTGVGSETQKPYGIAMITPDAQNAQSRNVSISANVDPVLLTCGCLIAEGIERNVAA
jgi:hypothetical protein